MSVTVETKTLNWACGLFATFLGIAALPPSLFYVYWAWLSWHVGDWPHVAFNLAIALLWLAVPVAFVVGYVRWQKRHGLQ